MTNVGGLRIGFLGAGLIATYHSKSLRRSGAEGPCGVVRAGVYDPDLGRAEAFAAASGHTVCASEDEVLDTCDAVYVCTWTSEHPRQVAKAVDRRLAVFCEKPLAIATSLAEQMTASVLAAGTTNQVGLILRRSAAYNWARHLIRDPAAGRVMTVVFRDDQFIPVQGHYASTWRSDRRLVGSGTLLEHSIHDVDMLRFLVDDVVRVSANTANFHGHDGIEDVANATLVFAGGAIGTLTSVWHDNLARPSLRRVEVFCERRYIVIEGDDWFGPVHWTDADGTSGSLGGDEIVAAAEPLLDGTMNPDGEFVRAVAEGRAAHPDFATALEAHRIVDAMYRSAEREGAMVAVVAAPAP
jgi:predicted dehydrogenase